VAAPAGVALGHDQHVLAQRREVIAAQRTAIGGRLAVLGAAHDPPPWGLGFGHDSKHVTAPVPRPARAIVPPVEQRDERIIVETVRHRITGLLRLPADGYRSRLTDYLNASERVFLALTDAEITSLDGAARVEQREFMALSVRHIVMAMPAEDSEPGD
jgi:hypothetical protein